MKKISILSILFLGIFLFNFTGCKKEDDPFMDDPDEKLTEYLKDVQKQLTSAEYGYKASLKTELDNHYFLYIQFGEDGRVDMLTDFNDVTAAVLKSSSYRLKALQRPSVLFDTYNYISIFADPEGSVNEGKNGEGLLGDNDFSFMEIHSDTIMLLGNKNSSVLKLTAATKDEQEAYVGGAILDSRNLLNNFLQRMNFMFLEESGKKISLTINTQTRKVVLNRLESDGVTIAKEVSPFEYREWGLQLGGGILIEGERIDKLYWDKDIEAYYINVKGQKKYVQDSSNSVFPLYLEFGDKKTYSIIGSATNELPRGVHSKFNSIWENVNNKFASSGRNVRYIELELISSEQATFSVYYSAGTTNFVADLSMEYVIENDIITFSKAKRDYSNSNWTTRILQLQELEDFIWNKKFRLDWVNSTNPNVRGIGGLYSLDDPDLFFYGILK